MVSVGSDFFLSIIKDFDIYILSQRAVIRLINRLILIVYFWIFSQFPSKFDSQFDFMITHNCPQYLLSGTLRIAMS